VTKWQAVIFDLDDTLYPERDYVLSGFHAVAEWAEAHLSIPAEQGWAELRAYFEAGIRGDTFNRWLIQHNLEPEPLVPRLIKVYREHQPRIAAFPEVPQLLARLRRAYRIGLLSDGYLEVQQRKITALALAPYFDAIVFSDEWGRTAWKPSPRPFEIALERLKVAAAQSVYVADNPVKDFLGARAAGLATVQVLRSDGEYAARLPPSAEHAPDRVIATLDELEFTLKQMESNL
jgi:putative hydrolase of the HAD superfamily